MGDGGTATTPQGKLYPQQTTPLFCRNVGTGLTPSALRGTAEQQPPLKVNRGGGAGGRRKPSAAEDPVLTFFLFVFVGGTETFFVSSGVVAVELFLKEGAFLRSQVLVVHVGGFILYFKPIAEGVAVTGVVTFTA